ncbi:SH3 domain-containing protein [Tenacibaculum sp. MEBiC06402]|uniref:SH3 domain-containing protein n=1 Tax=unclassified Tenacibaculum TaxID=2635139 RepID=UPI003B9B494F
MKYLTLLLLIIVANTFGQEVHYVDAPNGLIVRDAPSKNANRIGKFEFGTKISLINRSGQNLTIKDNGISIKGEWVEVEDSIENISGYVFSGFISQSNCSEYGYYLTKEDAIEESAYYKVMGSPENAKPLYLYLMSKEQKEIAKFPLGDLEFYEGSDANMQKASELKNINLVVNVSLNYSACCSYTKEFFFLLNKDEELVKLPMINNDHCDGPEPYFDYIFPMDKNGKKDKIIYAKIIPGEDYKVDSIEVLKTYSWNGEKLVEEIN